MWTPKDSITTLQKDYSIGPRAITETQTMALVKFVPFTGRSYERCVTMFKSFNINLHMPGRAFMYNGGGGIGTVVPYEHKVVYVKERVNTTGTDYENVKVEYSIKSLYDILRAHLFSVRDKKETFLSITLGKVHGKGIFLNLICDHGGKTFKVVMMLIAYEFDATLQNDYSIGP